MFMSIGEMGTPRHLLLLAATFLLIAFCKAGPVGNLPNVTSVELGLKEGSCAVGDVVYMEGDEFPGSSPCERCACAGSGVRCARQRCEPQAGCKAVHRPDQCCPIYQCECEQEGRVYANGEKLVDPNDPCRVCYCQGGEMVCRRIACFIRDDCLPRVVPGRCCPEYDNCPLRAVTAIPGVAPTISSTTTETTTSPAPQPPKENVRQEITIKEITPVSEIPAITEVKIKELLPSPAIEVADYVSSKSPVIVREATTEKHASTDIPLTPDTPVHLEDVSVPATNSLIPSEIPDTKTSESIVDVSRADFPPSKIAIPMQDNIDTPPAPISMPTLGVPVIPEIIHALSSSKATIVEEEDTGLFDHNPAFPPIPDDLSVIGNHEDEIVQEQNVDGVLTYHETPVVPSIVPSSDSVFVEQPDVTTSKVIQNPTTTTEAPSMEPFVDLSSVRSTNIQTTTGLEATTFKNNIDKNDLSQGQSMLNLRTAIPMEVQNLPSEEITETQEDKISTKLPTTTFDELLQYSTTQNPMKIEKATKIKFDEITVTQDKKILSTELPTTPFDESLQYSTTQSPIKLEKSTTEKFESFPISNEYPRSTVIVTEATSTSPYLSTQATVANKFFSLEEEVTPQPTQKSDDLATTEATARTERSIISTTERLVDTTSQRHPMTTENIFKADMTSTTTENVFKDTKILTTPEPIIEIASTKRLKNTILTTENPIKELSSTKISSSTESEVITVSRTIPSNTENQSFENVETTEFILTPLGSSESATDAVELIKISAEPEKSASIIEPQRPKNMLTDFINLVGDVAAIGDHTESPDFNSRTSTVGISESEELIPINIGYKSKNNNANVNSITEVPIKHKIVNKQKIVEIVDEDNVGIADSPPPNDKVEPTTRRPIIDNVSDDSRGNKTEKKDIEIITKSYVPTISRRPTKVVMKKSNEKPSPDGTTEATLISASAEVVTESTINVSSETGITGEPDIATAASDLAKSTPVSTVSPSTE